MNNLAKKALKEWLEHIESTVKPEMTDVEVEGILVSIRSLKEALKID